MSALRRLYRALFVLPFSAGDPKNLRNDGVISHDGSISGIVFLVSIVIILCEILLIGAFSSEEDSKQLFTVTMDITSGLAILICIILIVYSSLKPDIVNVNEHWDISSRIMMKFLWLFTLACLSYSAIYIAYHVDCLKNGYILENASNRILCDLLLFTYRLVQTGFLTHFSQRVFVSKLRFYYALLVLFLINVAVIVIDFANSVRHVNEFTLNDTTIKAIACSTNSSIFPFLSSAENFLDPAGTEYSLLTILFITHLWPKKVRKIEKRLSLERVSQNLGEDSPLINDEPIYDNISESLRIENPQRRTWTYFNIVCSVFVSIPAIILFILKIYTPKNHSVDKALNFCTGIQMTILFIVLIKCFYLMQSQCYPLKKDSSFSSKDYLILSSFIGSMAYYTMRLIPYILLLHSDTQNISKTYNYIVIIFGTYFQTVFLFQMKNYGKKQSEPSWISLEFTFLFLSITNFMVWAVDSFLAGQWVFVDDAPTIFYGKTVWVTFFELLYPFVIFYRFKCFVAFHGLYHRFSK